MRRNGGKVKREGGDRSGEEEERGDGRGEREERGSRGARREVRREGGEKQEMVKEIGRRGEARERWGGSWCYIHCRFIKYLNICHSE